MILRVTEAWSAILSADFQQEPTDNLLRLFFETASLAWQLPARNTRTSILVNYKQCRDTCSRTTNLRTTLQRAGPFRPCTLHTKMFVEFMDKTNLRRPRSSLKHFPSGDGRTVVSQGRSSGCQSNAK